MSHLVRLCVELRGMQTAVALAAPDYGLQSNAVVSNLFKRP